MFFGRRSEGVQPGDRAALAAQLRSDLDRVAALRGAVRAKPSDRIDRERLRSYQAARLARTYTDLLSSPRYRPAAEFFLSDLYGAADHEKRDRSVAAVVPTLVRMLPAGALRVIALAVRLDALSEDLDWAMVQALRADAGLDALDDARYARGWRLCGRQSDRELQRALVQETGQVLDRLTRMPAVGAVQKLMRAPAHAAGFGELHDFLERGFHAFRHMGNAGEFLAIILGRETELAACLFSGEAQGREPT